MNKVLLKCTIASAPGGLLFGYNTVIINGAMTDLVKTLSADSCIAGMDRKFCAYRMHFRDDSDWPARGFV